jgi:hypothetical protein
MRKTSAAFDHLSPSCSRQHLPVPEEAASSPRHAHFPLHTTAVSGHLSPSSPPQYLPVSEAAWPTCHAPFPWQMTTASDLQVHFDVMLQQKQIHYCAMSCFYSITVFVPSPSSLRRCLPAPKAISPYYAPFMRRFMAASGHLSPSSSRRCRAVPETASVSQACALQQTTAASDYMHPLSSH